MSALLEIEKTPETLGQYVRRIRYEKRLSQPDVEKRSGGPTVGISTEYIAKIEKGRALNPSGRKLAALARGLDVPPDEIFAFCATLPETIGASINDDFEQAALLMLQRRLKRVGPEDRKFIAQVIQMLCDQIDAIQAKKKRR